MKISHFYSTLCCNLLLLQIAFISISNRVVQKYTKYMISKNNKLLHVKLIIKIHVMECFDPLRPSGLSTASSCGSYSKGEVGSILGALEVPYTPEKKLYLPKLYVDYNFCYQKIFSN